MKTAVERYKYHVAALANSATWAPAYAELERAGAKAAREIAAGLKHPDARVRKLCAALLDHNADSRSVRALVEALNDADVGVRRLAVHAIGCQRCKFTPLDLDVVELLIERMEHDASIRVRQVAAHMLGNQAREANAPDKRSTRALENVLQSANNKKLRSNAAWALSQHQEKIVPC